MNYTYQWNGDLDPAVFFFIMVIYLVLFVWVLVNYIIRSLSLFTIAKRRGIPNYGLAWVPVAYLWTLGSIADQYDGSRGLKRKWRHVLLWLNLSGIIVYLAVYITMIATMFSTYMHFSRVGRPALDMLNPAVLAAFIIMGIALVCYCLLVAACGTCQTICTFKLYESARPTKAVLLLLLSLLVPFAAPFCLLACRNKDLGMPAPAGPNGPGPNGPCSKPITQPAGIPAAPAAVSQPESPVAEAPMAQPATEPEPEAVVQPEPETKPEAPEAPIETIEDGPLSL